MNKGRTIALIILAIIIVGTVLFIALNAEESVTVSDRVDDREAVIDEFADVVQDNAEDPSEEVVTIENDIPPAEVAAVSERYGEYSEALARSAAMEGRVVLFFHAPWCPTCRTFNAAVDADRIPENVVLLKVDYDSADALKRRHRVTYQHSFVEVDENLDMVQSWSGLSFDGFIDEIDFSNSSEHPYGNIRQPL